MEKKRKAPSQATKSKKTKYDKLFYNYADKSSGLINPDGVQSLCSDLEIKHTDIQILILAWKMKAKTQGYFTLNEWREGLEELEANTIIRIRKALKELNRECTTNSVQFLHLYSYSFTYSLPDNQKSIDIESACELLNLLVGNRSVLFFEKLIQYLKIQESCRVINCDQWITFLRFCNEINFPSLDNYTENDAWPVILDDFVEWFRG